MRTQRFATFLTVINLLILMPLLFRANSATTPDVAPVLRGRALEIVDDQGRVRAMIKVFPADPERSHKGKIARIPPPFSKEFGHSSQNVI
jgi:hypothetical protein